MGYSTRVREIQRQKQGIGIYRLSAYMRGLYIEVDFTQIRQGQKSSFRASCTLSHVRNAATDALRPLRACELCFTNSTHRKLCAHAPNSSASSRNTLEPRSKISRTVTRIHVMLIAVITALLLNGVQQPKGFHRPCAFAHF